MKHSTMRKGIQVGIAMLLATAAAAFPRQMDSKLTQALQQNSQALTEYTWKSRTEVRRNGESKSVQVAQVRYGRDGSLEKTTISSTPQHQLPTRGLRGFIAQRKKEQFVDEVETLGALAKSYSEIPPSSMQRFIANASVMPDLVQQQRWIRISGGRLLQADDSMTLWFDAASRRKRRVEIYTSLERKPVKIVSEFQDLPMGPTHMARSVIEYPSDQITLITENFDYQRIRQ